MKRALAKDESVIVMMFRLEIGRKCLFTQKQCYSVHQVHPYLTYAFPHSLSNIYFHLDTFVTNLKPHTVKMAYRVLVRLYPHIYILKRGHISLIKRN